MNSNPLQIIQDVDITLFEHVKNASSLAFDDGELSKKHKLLIAFAIDAAIRSENGMNALARQALASGATKNEILETLRIVNYICGVGSTYPAAVALDDVL